MADEPWLDDLSEDWNSCPRSSPPSLPSDRSTKADSLRKSIAREFQNRSRIPRSTNRTASSIPRSPRSSGDRSPAKRLRVLTERTRSENNIPILSSPAGTTKKVVTQLAVSQKSSSSAANSVVKRTPLARESEARCAALNIDNKETPEWKKLAMRHQGETELSPEDLFQPAPLASIFDKPAEPMESSPGVKPGFSFAQDLSTMPSSPPPWSSPQRLDSQPSVRKCSELKSSGVILETLEEQDEQEVDLFTSDIPESLYRKDGTSEITVDSPVLKSDKVIPQQGCGREEDTGEVQNRDFDEIEPQDAQDAPLGASQRPQDTIQHHPSSYFSGSSVCESNDFSPVFISKHNTADGQIDYKALDPADLNFVRKFSGRGDQNSAVSKQEPSGESHLTTLGNAPQIPLSRARTPSIAEIGEFVSCERGGHPSDDSFLRKPLSSSASTTNLVSDSIVPSDSVSQVQEVESTIHDQRPNNATADVDVQPIESGDLDSSKRKTGRFSNALNDSLQGQEGLSSDIARSENVAKDDTHQPELGFEPRSSSFITPTETAGICIESEIAIAAGSSDSGTQEQQMTKQAGTMEALVATELNVAEASTVVGDLDQAKQNKRVASSSNRAPTPKRIRTLIPADITFAKSLTSGPSNVQGRVLPQRITGKKRKDARYDEGTISDPASILQRSILRPRNPTPSLVSRGRQPNSNAALSNDSNAIGSNLKKDGSFLINGELENSHLRAIASEVATFRCETRKPSVSTQDYLNEAMKIMDLIRARKRTQSDVSTICEDIVGDSHDQQIPGILDETVSRPPSAEGRFSGWRQRSHQKLDSRVLSHLRKYEETGDESFLVSSIVRSVKASEQAGLLNSGAECSEGGEKSLMRRRNSDSSMATFMHRDTGNNQDLACPPLRKDPRAKTPTTPTSSFQKVRNLTMISPEHVSHLINEAPNGMKFDAQKQTWIRNRGVRQVLDAAKPFSSSTGTEDPLEGIPDLSINEGEEQRSAEETSLVSQTHKLEHSIERDSQGSLVAAHSLVASELSLHTAQCDGSDGCDPQSHSEQLSKASLSTVRKGAKRKNRTVLFSSPPTLDEGRARRHISLNIPLKPATENEDDDSEVRTESSLIYVASDVKAFTSQFQDKGAADPRTMSSNQQECHEISFTKTRPNGRTMSLTLSISTPLPAARWATTGHQLSSGRGPNNWLRSLSPLSEFSVNQNDNAHFVSNGLTGQLRLSDRPNRPSIETAQAVEDLVQRITDAKPDDPYWEFLQSLDLHDMSLSSLYLLNEICPRLEELHVSGNKLRSLDGAPPTLRYLSLYQNSLSSLTRFNHLQNLQYLDVSGNDLNSLDSLNGLVHLRTLKAENNSITTLDGILDLDGLLELQLRGNALTKINLVSSRLKRLITLDLRENSISSLSGLSSLPKLETLDISSNMLMYFTSSEDGENSNAVLTTLLINHNELSFLDAGIFPQLQDLHADGNLLTCVSNVVNHNNLTTISLRNQRLPTDAHLVNLNSYSNITHLYLSGSKLPPLLPLSEPFFNLLTLDVSFTGIQALPSKFGMFTPHLQTLNLNENRIEDLRSLNGIVGLKVLLAANNRVSRLRGLIKVLRHLAPFRKSVLEELDLRGNPMTNGFYGSIHGKLEATKTHAEASAADQNAHKKPESSKTRLEHIQPHQRLEEDAHYFARLDNETKMRRRMYEMLVFEKCATMKTLDGRLFDQSATFASDDTWEMLVGFGFVVEVDDRGCGKQCM